MNNKFIRNSLLLISIELIAKGLGMLFFIFVARFLGARDLGLFAFAMAVANFIVIPAKFGFEDLVQREVSRKPAGTYYYFLNLGAVKGLISGLLLVFYLLGLLLWHSGDTAVMAMAAAFVMVYSFMEFINSFFRANQRAELELGVRLCFSVCNILLGIAILYAGYRLKGVLVTQLASIGVAVALALFTLQRVAAREEYDWEWGALWRQLAVAAPFAGILVALYLSNQIGVVILNFLSGKEDVGYFASAYRIFDALTLIPAAVTGAFLPVMSLYHVRSLGEFVRTLRFTLKYLFVLTAPLVVCTTLLAQPIIIFLYREAFAPSIPALQILGLSLIFSFWNFAAQSVLVARNLERLVLVSIWVVAGVHVAANFLLIPGFSFLGACWAVLVTQVIYCAILFAYLLQKYLSFRQLLGLIAIPALAAAVMGLAVYLMRQTPLMISILTGLLVYGGTLWVLGGVTSCDQNYLRRIMTPGSGKLSAG